jgi:hypothetical protein
LAFLRDEGELTIITPDGSKKPRAKTINWDDRLVPAIRAIAVQSPGLVMETRLKRRFHAAIAAEAMLLAS